MLLAFKLSWRDSVPFSKEKPQAHVRRLVAVERTVLRPVNSPGTKFLGGGSPPEGTDFSKEIIS